MKIVTFSFVKMKQEQAPKTKRRERLKKALDVLRWLYDWSRSRKKAPQQRAELVDF